MPLAIVMPSPVIRVICIMLKKMGGDLSVRCIILILTSLEKRLMGLTRQLRYLEDALRWPRQCARCTGWWIWIRCPGGGEELCQPSGSDTCRCCRRLVISLGVVCLLCLYSVMRHGSQSFIYSAIRCTQIAIKRVFTRPSRIIIIYSAFDSSRSILG